MEIEAIPACDKNIEYVYSEWDQKYLPQLKYPKKAESRLKPKLLIIQNDDKKLIEMIDIMIKSLDSDNKRQEYEDYIDTKKFIDCFKYIGHDVKYYKEKLNIFI